MSKGNYDNFSHLLGLQEPKGGFKLYLLSSAGKKWLTALHLPEQVATRATVDLVQMSLPELLEST